MIGRPFAVLLIGVALAALIAFGGRSGVQYFDGRAENETAKADHIKAQSDECLKRDDAEHPNPGGAGEDQGSRKTTTEEIRLPARLAG
jgi:hypothetical protein